VHNLNWGQKISVVGVLVLAVFSAAFILFVALDAFTAPTFSLYKAEWVCVREANRQGPGVNKPYRYKECVLWRRK